MKSTQIEVLDFKLPCLFYETVDEGDKAAGRAGAVLDECNKNLQYRGANADARDMIVLVVASLTSVNPLEEQAKDKDGKPVLKDGSPVMEVTENEAKFVKRAIAVAEKAGNTTIKQQIQDEVERRARDGWTYTDDEGKEVKVEPLAVDIKARERKAPKPPKLSQEVKNQASGFLDNMDDEKIVKALRKWLPDATFARTGDKDKDIEALGWKLRDWVKAKEKAALAEFGHEKKGT